MNREVTGRALSLCRQIRRVLPCLGVQPEFLAAIESLAPLPAEELYLARSLAGELADREAEPLAFAAFQAACDAALVEQERRQTENRRHEVAARFPVATPDGLGVGSMFYLFLYCRGRRPRFDAPPLW